MKTIVNRYVKSSDWDSAIDVLYGGALALLKAGQGGSGGDLGCYLVDAFGKSEKVCGSGEKGARIDLAGDREQGAGSRLGRGLREVLTWVFVMQTSF